jgi:hypothetical protein
MRWGGYAEYARGVTGLPLMFGRRAAEKPPMPSSSISHAPASSAARALRPLAAGLAVSSVGSLFADVIHSSTVLSGSQTFAIDPGDDFTFSVFPGTFGFFDPMSKIMMPGTPSSVTLDPINGAMVTTAAVSFGAQIDGSSGFTDAAAFVAGTQYLGFSLPGTTTLYGWISVTHLLGMGTGSGTVNEWAYDNTGAGIAVGQTSAVPEPANAAAIAALLAGSAVAMQRRRQKLGQALAA